MRRRQFILLLGGAAITWPRAAHAQKPDRVRRIGVLMPFAAGDAEGLHRAKVFSQGLQDLGWVVGQDVRFEYRWPDGDIEQIQALAKELVGSRPDVLVAFGITQLAALQQATRTIPIVFVASSDPVGQGIVESMARPGGNATGFAVFEPSMAGKWLELLKEMVPGLRRVAVILAPDAPAVGTSYLHSVETAAASFSVEATGAPVHDTVDIERAISSLAREPSGGLIVPPGAFTASHRKQIAELAAQYRVPTIYAVRYFAADGGLLSYGVDSRDMVRQATSYVDRILRGANPADLPVQEPTKFQLVINLKTAKALGLTVPPSLLARADEVIE